MKLYSIGLFSWAFFCATLVLEISSLAAEDWPRWSGPRGDFISSDVDWSTDWPESGLRQVWEQELGIGFSSAAVVDGLVYSMGRDGEQDVVYCFAADDGTEKWSYRYDANLFDNLHEGGPGATPTVDGQQVFTVSRDGLLHCFEKTTGKLQWKLDFAEAVEIEAPEWGYTSSALIIGDKILLEAGRLIAVDRHSGKPIWTSETRYKPGYGTPVLMSSKVDGPSDLVATLNNDCLQIVTLDAGKEIAQFPWKTSYATSSSTPVVLGKYLFVSTGYGQGCVLVEFDGSTLKEIYTSKKLANHMNNSVLFEGHFYGVHGNAHNARVCTVTCMEALTGEVKWSHRGLGCGSLFIAGDRLVILSDQGELVCAKASSDDFQELSRAKVLEGKCWTVPVLVDNHVFCRSAEGRLVCVELPK
jgi:outer membrane protein assembly factor BamB